jgi:NAD(P)-dependent dehydrogenase (short-subunit alcohol dehydrogenase family)
MQKGIASDESKEHFGALHILLNNAGMGNYKPLIQRLSLPATPFPWEISALKSLLYLAGLIRSE